MSPSKVGVYVALAGGVGLAGVVLYTAFLVQPVFALALLFLVMLIVGTSIADATY
jgi:hypothetical protein